MRITVCASAIAVLTIACSNFAAAQGETLHHDSATAVAALAPSMPTNVSGFELVQTLTPPAANVGKWYKYVHDKIDTVDVVVSPLPPISIGDTAGYVFQTADQFRLAYDQAFHTGVILGYAVTSARTDPVHIKGRATNGYLLESVFKRKTSSEVRYSFYAVYATPEGLVRIRTELPSYRKSTGTLVNFAHTLLDSMVQ